MTKELVNTIIINGLKSKGIFIGNISPEVLEAFAGIMYKAINYTPCCKSDSEQLCPNCLCKPIQKLGFCNECFDNIYSHA